MPLRLDFILGSLKRGMGRSVSLTHVPCYCTRCVRRACQDALRFTFCLLLQMACPPHQQWKNLFFKFIFKIRYIITSPVIGRAQLLWIVTKKPQKTPPHLIMWFPSSHWFFKDHPCRSAKSKETSQGSGLKRDRTWDSFHGAILFQSVRLLWCTSRLPTVKITWI